MSRMVLRTWLTQLRQVVWSSSWRGVVQIWQVSAVVSCIRGLLGSPRGGIRKAPVHGARRQVGWWLADEGDNSVGGSVVLGACVRSRFVGVFRYRLGDGVAVRERAGLFAGFVEDGDGAEVSRE